MPFIMLSGKVGKNKKKPPPRPPPPNFSKYKSKSSLFLNQQTDNLIDLDSPDSPKVERKHNIGGSVSSSFSSSTSSLASSKKSLDYDFPFLNNIWPISTTSTSVTTYSHTQTRSTFYTTAPNQGTSKNIPSGGVGPTIIKPKVLSTVKTTAANNDKLPMPDIPPPSPPKDVDDVNIAYGIALYDYQGTEPSDLSFQVNDVIVLIRKINEEWYYGKVLDKEGMFPASFIDVQVPLAESNDTVMALYEFEPQMSGDLALKPGQMIKVLKKINKDWLYGSSNGNTGQFPANFVDRIPDI